jgi:trimeric autotransporter adhesin
VNLAPLVTTGVLNASCTMDPNTGNTLAQSSVDGATLLGGAIRLSVVTSTCHSTANGVTRSSNVVGTINGVPITAGPATIGIPGVAVVHLNESTTGPNGQLVQNAVRVEVLGLLGIVTQTVILSSCYIN